MGTFVAIVLVVVAVIIVVAVVVKLAQKDKTEAVQARAFDLVDVALGRPIDRDEYLANEKGPSLQRMNVYVSIPGDTALRIGEDGEHVVLVSRDASGQIRQRSVPSADILASELAEDEVTVQRTVTKNQPSVLGSIGGALLGREAGAIIGGLGHGSSRSATTTESLVNVFKFRLVIDDPVEPLFTLTWRNENGKPVSKAHPDYAKFMEILKELDSKIQVVASRGQLRRAETMAQSGIDVVKQLSLLSDLKQRGDLTAEEFDVQKKRLLEGSRPVAQVPAEKSGWQVVDSPPLSNPPQASQADKKGWEWWAPPPA